MQTYFWVGLIFFLAGFNQGLSGFGSILVAIPLLSIFLDIKTVIPLTNLCAVPIAAMLLYQLRKDLDWRKIYLFLVGAVPGIPVGIFVLKSLDKGVLQFAIGAILILYSGCGLFSAIKPKTISENWAYPFGFASGCMAGAISAAAPPIIVYTTLQAWTKDQIKVTLQGFFFLSGIVVVSLHLLTGVTNLTVIQLFIAALFPLLFGAYCGSLLYGRLDEIRYRKLLLIFLVFLGGLMIYRSQVLFTN